MERQTYILTRDGTRLYLARHDYPCRPYRDTTTDDLDTRDLSGYELRHVPRRYPHLKDSEKDDFDWNEWVKTAYGEGVLYYDVSPIDPAWALVYGKSSLQSSPLLSLLSWNMLMDRSKSDQAR
jgi:hypothetical protein